MNNKEVITKEWRMQIWRGDDDQKAEAVGFVSLMSLSEENTPRHLTVSSQSSQNHQVIWASQDQVQPHITISEGDHQGWGVQRWQWWWWWNGQVAVIIRSLRNNFSTGVESATSKWGVTSYILITHSTTTTRQQTDIGASMPLMSSHIGAHFCDQYFHCFFFESHIHHHAVVYRIWAHPKISTYHPAHTKQKPLIDCCIFFSLSPTHILAFTEMMMIGIKNMSAWVCGNIYFHWQWS